MESSTLPTRFNTAARKRGSLTLFEDILNTNGNQTLFELHASVTRSSNNSNSQPNGRDRILNGNQQGGGDPAAYASSTPSRLDIDYSPDTNALLATRSSHVFSQVESDRDGLEADSRTSSLTPEERLRRRLNDESVVEM